MIIQIKRSKEKRRYLVRYWKRCLNGLGWMESMSNICNGDIVYNKWEIAFGNSREHTVNFSLKQYIV